MSRFLHGGQNLKEMNIWSPWMPASCVWCAMDAARLRMVRWRCGLVARDSDRWCKPGSILVNHLLESGDVFPSLFAQEAGPILSGPSRGFFLLHPPRREFSSPDRGSRVRRNQSRVNCGRQLQRLLPHPETRPITRHLSIILDFQEGIIMLYWSSHHALARVQVEGFGDDHSGWYCIEIGGIGWGLDLMYIHC